MKLKYELSNTMLYEALQALQYPKAGGHIDCLACERRCSLREGATGFCSGYSVQNGILRDLTYGKITTAQITELGWAPVSRFANPSDKTLAIGTRGCNLRCTHCVNHEHAFARHSKDDNFVSPETIVEYAVAMDCRGVSANFNEGLLAARYWFDIFTKARQNGLYSVAVTNGYATQQVLDLICPVLDVYRCDIKAISERAMRRQGNQGINPQHVLDNLVHIRQNHPATHIETVTMISPGVNDSPEEISGIASWINNNLGTETPWHLSPMAPVDMSGLVFRNPRYLNTDDLVNGDKVRGLSMSFGDTAIRVDVGNSDLLSLTPTILDMASLQRVAQIGKESGLRDVIIKTDGH